MESRKDQLQVLEHFNKALKADKARPQIAQLSELGLVELTRHKAKIFTIVWYLPYLWGWNIWCICLGDQASG